MGGELTVAFDLASVRLDYVAEVRPARQVLEVEGDVVRLGQGVEVAR